MLIKLKDEITIKDLIYRGKELIEQNTYLLKYSDDKLYKHQKILFREFKNNTNPKLILYLEMRYNNFVQIICHSAH